MTRTVSIFTIVVALTSPGYAQEVSGRPGPRQLLPRERELALARSAAPAAVSAAARVWYFDGGTYLVADSGGGGGGTACYVSRSWPESLEPHCFDEEGARTIMPMEMRRVELLHRGVGAEAVEREIADGLASGRFRLPQRPAMSWMMSSAQVLYNDEGRRVGAWRPHVMIYYPWLTAAGSGTGRNQDPNAGIVVSAGKPESNLMIVVGTAVDPAPAPAGGGTRP